MLSCHHCYAVIDCHVVIVIIRCHVIIVMLSLSSLSCCHCHCHHCRCCCHFVAVAVAVVSSRRNCHFQLFIVNVYLARVIFNFSLSFSAFHCFIFFERVMTTKRDISNCEPAQQNNDISENKTDYFHHKQQHTTRQQTRHQTNKTNP